MRYATLLLSLFVVLIPAAGRADVLEVGKPAPNFTATAADGESVKLSDYMGKIVVLEWNNPQCPFVRKHYGSGNMQQLQAYAKSRDVVWLAINSGAPGREGNMDKKQSLEYIKQANLTVTHYLLDPQGKIGRLYGAKTTPHMFVIDEKGRLAYMGAIDDKPTANVTDVPNAKNYVRAAIDDLMAGKPVEISATQSYGCSVKYASN